ncbi:hypothetical protein V6Z11_A11G173300 [Gossypium hirsutum]
MNTLKHIDNNFYGDMESHFLSLEVLEICRAPCLEELTTVNGREHFPLLSSVTIIHCPNLFKSLMMTSIVLTFIKIGDFHELTDLLIELLPNQKHLDRLSIVSKSLKSLYDLPDNLSTLTYLNFQVFFQLESLLGGLQNLSSLEISNLNYCDSLVSFLVLISLPNEIQHLTLLLELNIWKCYNLTSLPQGIPSLTVLKTLKIEECPHLEKRYKKEIGEDWPNITYIPSI